MYDPAKGKKKKKTFDIFIKKDFEKYSELN